MNPASIQLILKSVTKLLPDAIGVAVSNENQFIHLTCDADVDLPFAVGDLVSEENVTGQALQKGREASGETTNGAYYAIAVPHFENDTVVGALTVFYRQNLTGLSVPYLTVKKIDRWIPIPFIDVIFMEAQHRKTHLVSAKHQGTHRNNLTELENILPKDIFFRCHRSYIINMHQIKEIQPDSHSTFVLVMTDQSRVPVSQNYAKEIRGRFGF